MVIYIPFIYLTIWNFKGCSRSVVTYWLGLSIDFWKFLGELLSSNLTSTRFILKSQQRKCMVFQVSLREQISPPPLHRNLLLFKSMRGSLHTSLHFGSYGLNLRTKSLCSMRNRAPPVLWTPFSISHKEKKSLFDSVITFSIIPHGNQADKQPISPAIKGHLMSTAVLTPAWQVDRPLRDSPVGERTHVLNKTGRIEKSHMCLHF